MLGDSSGRCIEYSSFDKPIEISKGGHTTRFAYNPSRARYLRTDQNSRGATTITRYLGNVERITHPNGRLEVKCTLPGGALMSYTLSAKIGRASCRERGMNSADSVAEQNYELTGKI